MLGGVSPSRESRHRWMAGVFRRVEPATLLLLGVVALLVIVALSAAAESAVDVGQGWVPRAGRAGDSSAGDEPPRDDEYETPPMLRAAAAMGLLVLMLVILLIALFGLVSIVLGIQLGWRRRQKRIGLVPLALTDDGPPDRVDVFRKAAGHALDRLTGWTGGDPGDAVVLAWLTLERAAADCGLARQPHQTPTEFTTAVLAELAVDAAALYRLRGRYQRARFSDHPVTEADVRAAQDALRRIVADLDRHREHAVAAGSGGDR